MYGHNYKEMYRNEGLTLEVCNAFIYSIIILSLIKALTKHVKDTFLMRDEPQT